MAFQLRAGEFIKDGPSKKMKNCFEYCLNLYIVLNIFEYDIAVIIQRSISGPDSCLKRRVLNP